MKGSSWTNSKNTFNGVLIDRKTTNFISKQEHKHCSKKNTIKPFTINKLITK